MALLSLLVWRGVLAAPIDIIEAKEKTILNDNCKVTQTCDLNKVKFRTVNYAVDLDSGDPNFGSEIIGIYETTTIPLLENYVFVSYVKGCKFDSNLNSNGEVEKRAIGYAVYSFDDVVKFKFPDWVINSADKDPTYMSQEGSPRHYFYAWTDIPGEYYNQTRHYYGEELPPTPSLYVNELASQAWYNQDTDVAVNLSMNNKMCLYKVQDVPQETVRTDVDWSKALFCHDWNASWVYNFKTKKWDNPKDIDPVCLE